MIQQVIIVKVSVKIMLLRYAAFETHTIRNVYTNFT